MKKVDNRIKIEDTQPGDKIQLLPTGTVWSVLAHEGGYTQVKSTGTTKWIKAGKKIFPVIDEI